MSSADIGPAGETAIKAVPVFAALGDLTRLSLVRRLGDGRAHSITSLTRDASITRQAVTKHLDVLERAGLVTSSRVGRESHYRLRPEPVAEARSYLDEVSRQWDEALTRLKSFLDE